MKSSAETFSGRVIAFKMGMVARLLAMAALLGVTGMILGRVVEPVWAAMKEREPALSLRSTAAAAGNGALLAILGGFRTILADGLWIRLYAGWERREIAGTDALVRLVTAVDPRPAYFWQNGARILAYDLADWRVHEAGGYEVLGEVGRRSIEEEQARAAIAHLDAAMPFHAENPDLWIERATIALNRLHDFEMAAESYRHAWELPRGPYYAARLHAEVLRRDGRRAEALAWLVKLHPKLPVEDEAAAAGLVLNRIRQLEHELGVSAENVYRPPAPSL
ncbi:MAG: hypothetical protein WD941_06775 [Opitutus sp.]